MDAWTDLLSRGGTLTTILPQLAVLVAFAAGFLAIATVRMRRIFSPDAHTMVVYGDSHGGMWFQTLNSIARSIHWRLTYLGKP